jgi:hypothetical protein
VTHQGSLPPRPDGLLTVGLTGEAPQLQRLEVTREPQPTARPSTFIAGHCHFCGRGCAEWVRSGFLRRRALRCCP